MATARRVGSATSEKRALILAATEQLMIEEGYAAVSSRSVAARAGINAPLVHYYFPTLDDLFVALLRRGADRNLERIAEALASPAPLQALWRLSSDRRGVTFLVELMAAANRREAVRAEVAALAKKARRMQIAGLRTLLPEYGLDDDVFPAELVAAAIQGIALLLVQEQTLGVATGHRAVVAATDRLLDDLEQRRAPKAPD